MEYGLRLWSFAADMNGDGGVTISDVSLWFQWLFFYPGDAFFYNVMLYLPKVTQFFELTVSSYGGWVSGVISYILWIITMGVVGSIYKFLDQN